MFNSIEEILRNSRVAATDILLLNIPRYLKVATTIYSALGSASYKSFPLPNGRSPVCLSPDLRLYPFSFGLYKQPPTPLY